MSSAGASRHTFAGSSASATAERSAQYSDSSWWRLKQRVQSHSRSAMFWSASQVLVAERAVFDDVGLLVPYQGASSVPKQGQPTQARAL
jgi:hypothetical protein